MSHDEQIARGLALEEHMSHQEPPASKTVTPSTSSTATASASSKMKLNIYLQDTTQKFRATAASRRRDQVTNEMLSLIKDANKHANEEDDELDLSFASMAKRMRKNLNEKQQEKVLSGIQKLVSSAIENAEAGLPVIPPPPPKHASNNPYSNTYPPTLVCWASRSTISQLFAKFLNK